MINKHYFLLKRVTKIYMKVDLVLRKILFLCVCCFNFYNLLYSSMILNRFIKAPL